MDYTKLATDQSLEKTKTSLEANGFKVLIAKDKKEVRELVLSLIPEGSSIMDNTSKTLEAIGIKDIIQNSGKYNSIHKKVLSMYREIEGKRIKELRSVMDFVIGSFHAVTEDGHIMMASGSGSQIPGYAYGASNVIFIAGTHKIVKDIESGMKRIYQHSQPLENERMLELHGVPSNPRRILIINSESAPRTTVIFVKEALGF